MLSRSKKSRKKYIKLTPSPKVKGARKGSVNPYSIYLKQRRDEIKAQG
jgi:hypothetical protein